MYVKSVAGEVKVAAAFLRNLSFKGVTAVASRNMRLFVVTTEESAFQRDPTTSSIDRHSDVPVVEPIVTEAVVAVEAMLTEELKLAVSAMFTVSE